MCHLKYIIETIYLHSRINHTKRAYCHLSLHVFPIKNEIWCALSDVASFHWQLSKNYRCRNKRDSYVTAFSQIISLTCHFTVYFTNSSFRLRTKTYLTVGTPF